MKKHPLLLIVPLLVLALVMASCAPATPAPTEEPMEEPTEEPTEEPMEEPTPIGEQMVLPLYVMPVTRPYMPDAEGVAQAVAADLAAIGIQTELVSLGDWTLYLDERRNGRLTGLYFLGWTGDNGDPSSKWRRSLL